MSETEAPRSPHSQAKTSIDKIHEGKQARDLAQKHAEEERKNVSLALNALFHTPNGRKAWQYLIAYCGIWNNTPTRDATKLLEDHGKKLVLTDGIIPLLERKTLDYLEKK